MKIEYNKVTWYSKLLAAIVVFGVLPALSFYMGILYQKVQEIDASVSVIENPIHITITKSQAEAIAGPIIKKCWGNQSNNLIKNESLTTNLITNMGVPFWNVGGNYTDGDLYIKHSVYGELPEVNIDAQTGAIMGRHFSEIGLAPGGEECNS